MILCLTSPVKNIIALDSTNTVDAVDNTHIDTDTDEDTVDTE